MFIFAIFLSLSASAGVDEGVTAYNNGDYAAAIKEWQPLAKSGDANAQHNLGLIYQYGYGVKKDLVKAAVLYRKAAEQGDTSSQIKIGLAYEEGLGVKKDASKAVEWYRKAAEQGDAKGQLFLGIAYEVGQSVPKDAAEAVSWYRKAAEQGDAQAQTNLGAMYYSGRGIEKDFLEATNWIRKAAEQGYARAEDFLGDAYYFGNGVSKNFAEAVKWYRKAAEQGYAGAQYSLGFMYARGQGVYKDENEAMNWLRKSANQGNGSAKEELVSIETKRLQAEQEIAAKRQRVTQVGQKICATLNNTAMSMSTGWQVMGQEVFQKYNGRTDLVGFVEGSSGNKIQIRISGMTFSGSINNEQRMGNRMPENIRESMSSFSGYKGSNLNTGGIIWDDYQDWSPCY